MDDLISRQALCEYALNQKDKSVTPNDIMRFPSAQSDLDEWCTDCKEYDSEKNCCPRFNRVIRGALNEGLAESTDAISREVVLKICRRYWHPTYNPIMEEVEYLPFVQLEQKVGHWIVNVDDESTISGSCSACGWQAHLYEDDVVGMNFCPNCGSYNGGGK